MLKQTTIWVHRGHMKRLAKLAKARGVSMSTLVRLAIGEYLRKEEKANG